MPTPGAVLQNAGIGNAIDTSSLTQSLQHIQDTNLRKQELARKNAEDQKQKDEAGMSRFSSKYLGDPGDLNTGSPMDPNNIQLRSAIMSKATELYSKHTSDMDVVMQLAPDIAKLQKYINTAKTITDQKKLILGNMEKEAKEKGWNINNIDRGVTNSLFYGPDGKLKDPSTMSTDVQGAIGDYIKQNPDQAANHVALEDYIKKYPQSTFTKDVKAYDPEGGMNQFKAEIGGPNFLTTENSAKGETVQVPRYQEAVDMGKKIYHDFPQKDGSIVKAPVRLLDENEYKKLMDSDAATPMLGLIKKHIDEYTDENGKPLSLNSPKAEMIGRAIAYDEFSSRAEKVVKSVAVENKPSSVQAHVNQYGDRETEARDKERGSRLGTQDVLGTEEKRAENRAAGTALGNQEVKGTKEQQSYDAAKGAAAAKNGAARPGSTGAATQSTAQEDDRIDRFEKAKDKDAAVNIVKKLEGTKLADGSTIKTIDKTSMLNWQNDFYITVEKGGKTEDIKFKDKKALADYLKKNKVTTTAPAASTPDAEAAKNKYGIKY